MMNGVPAANRGGEAGGAAMPIGAAGAGALAGAAARTPAAAV